MVIGRVLKGRPPHLADSPVEDCGKPECRSSPLEANLSLIHFLIHQMKFYQRSVLPC